MTAITMTTLKEKHNSSNKIKTVSNFVVCQEADKLYVTSAVPYKKKIQFIIFRVS